jgi:hypothetical protein
VKAVSQFDEKFPWIIPVETTEGLAIVEIHTAIGHIQSVQRCGESVTEILAEGKIEGCVLRQVVPRIRLISKGVAEAGAVINVRRRKRSPRKIDFAAEVESIALVVIERKQWSRRREVRQTAVNG